MTKKTSDRESNNLATLPEQGRKRQKEKRMAKKKKKKNPNEDYAR